MPFYGMCSGITMFDSIVFLQKRNQISDWYSYSDFKFNEMKLLRCANTLCYDIYYTWIFTAYVAEEVNETI